MDEPVEVLDVDDDLDRAVLDDDEHDPEMDVIADELLAAVEDDESWSDDPVRMYLTQMGEIPLLTRQEEVALAKQIEITRAKFRHKVLECDYVMQTAVKVLRRVQEGDLPFDRTVQVSVTDHSRSTRFSAGCRTISARWKLCSSGTGATTTLPPASRGPASGERRGGGWGGGGGERCACSKNSACGRSGSSR